MPQDVVERSVQRHLQAMVDERALLDDDTEDDLAAVIEADRAAVGKQPLPQPPTEAEDRDEKPLSHA